MPAQSSVHFYLNWAKERLDEMDATLAVLDGQIAKMQADARTKAQQFVAKLRAKRDEFERYHARLPQRQRLQKLTSFGTLRHVHDEDDPTAFCLEVPLINLSREMEAGRLAHLRRHDRESRLALPRFRKPTNGQHPCGGNDEIPA